MLLTKAFQLRLTNAQIKRADEDRLAVERQQHEDFYCKKTVTSEDTHSTEASYELQINSEISLFLRLDRIRLPSLQAPDYCLSDRVINLCFKTTRN